MPLQFLPLRENYELNCEYPSLKCTRLCWIWIRIAWSRINDSSSSLRTSIIVGAVRAVGAYCFRLQSYCFHSGATVNDFGGIVCDRMGHCL